MSMPDRRMGVDRRAPAAAPQRPTPLPKRPKGRWFVGGILLTVLLGGGLVVWNTFFRYAAYGVLEGRVLDVAAPSDGVVVGLHVREGDRVEPGQLLVSLQNLNLEHQIARHHDALRVAQAELSAEIAKIQLGTDALGDRAQKALAEYYELWATLRREEFQLEDHAVELRRVEELRQQRHGGVSDAEWSRRQFEHAGQSAKVEKLRIAVEELRRRSEIHQTAAPRRLAQLEPITARIESLQAEAGRLREQLVRTQICAPVGGVVIQQHRFTGEHAKTGEALLRVLEAGTVEAVLYVPQRNAARWCIGDDVDVVVAPVPGRVSCRVVRISPRLEAPPTSVERYYRSREHLLAVHLRPSLGPQGPPAFWLGAEVSLPLTWQELFPIARPPRGNLATVDGGAAASEEAP